MNDYERATIASERFEKFAKDFGRLKQNRANVPLERLQTQYAESYNALVADVMGFAEWFAEEFIKSMGVEPHPRDPQGAEWIRKKINAIKERERQPNGLYTRMRTALLDDLDRDAFEDAVADLYEKMETEVYAPYVRNYNKTVVDEHGRTRLYNILFGAFWYSNAAEQYGGHWINKAGGFVRGGFPPERRQK